MYVQTLDIIETHKEKITINDINRGFIYVIPLDIYSDSVRIMRRWKSGK